MSSKVRFLIFISLIVIITISCVQPESSDYVDQLGDIPFNSKIDDFYFKLCDANNVKHSRLSLTYDEGWKGLNDECMDNFNYQSDFQSFTGYVMIRFLINCNYELGRFRVETMDLRFNSKIASDKLTQHLISIVGGLKKWKRTDRYTDEVDCSKFLNFKIVDGKIENIIH